MCIAISYNNVITDSMNIRKIFLMKEDFAEFMEE